MNEELKKISLNDVLRHSSLAERVEVFPGCMVNIRPWTAAVMDEIQPLLKRIFRQIKDVMAQNQEGETDYLDLLLNLLEDNSNNMRDVIADILHVLYVTIERDNRKLSVKNDDGTYTEYGLFQEEEMREELPIGVIANIIRVIYNQNFAKNLFKGS